MKYIENFFYTEKIEIPSNIKVEQVGNLLYFEGPLGFIELDFCKIDSLGLGFFRIIKETKPGGGSPAHLHKIEIFVKKDSKNSKAFFGSFLSLLKNTFHGVSQGFLVYLELVGVGFRANIIGGEACPKGAGKSTSPKNPTKIEFKIGQSHERIYSMPENIHVFSLKPTLLCFYGLDKIQITQIAAEIRDFMRPEPYKGKGIRYKDEEIQIKVGKKK